MENHFKRRRFYSENLTNNLSKKDSKDNPIPDFTLPDSPKISNLELIHEIDDFKLDEEGDIFSDFLGMKGKIDKASLFNQLTNASANEEEDSFEIEIASRKENQKIQKESGTTKVPDSTEKTQIFENSLKGKAGLLLLEEGQELSGFDPFGGKKTESSQKGELKGKGFVTLQSTTKEVKLGGKEKMFAEMFNFKVDVSKSNFGNRNRSQSYSMGQSNSIFDFLNRR